MSEAATILIVDDTPANLAVAVDMLEQRGFRVLVAEDGEEGLQRAELAGPDLILLDVMMPVMDGFEACRRLKAAASTQDIPVIFMTALADSSHKLDGFAAGGADYVAKPFDVAELLARIDTHLALRAARRRLAEQNRELQREVAERRHAETVLQAANEQLKAAQGQLLQSEKMASIGFLAAGVAHEINNPVGYVSSNLCSLGKYTAQLLALIAVYEAAETALAAAAPAQLEAIREAKERAELDFVRQDLMTLVSECKDGLGRVGRIVDDLKGFSHRGESRWQPADLNRELDSTLNLVAHELKYKATVKRDGRSLPEIECVPLELNQVFVNLLVNAAHAIVDHGEVAIRTGVEAHEVWVEIADTGAGIAPEHLPHIFDPFFTTKPVGKGTGLGLALSYATVKKHHGRIDVSSSPGQGTTFRVWLPIEQPDAECGRDEELQSGLVGTE